MKQGKRLKVGFSDVRGWIIGALGAVASVVSAFRTETNGFISIFIGLLAAELLVAIIWSWSLFDRQKKNRNLEDLQSSLKVLEEKNQELQRSLEVQEKEATERLNDVLRKMEVISVNQKNASKLNNEFCTRIPDIAERSYRMLETLQSSEIKDTELLQREIHHAINEFAIGLYDVYKRYSSNLLNCLVAIEEAYLAAKGLKKNVSATIKLFDKPYYSKENGRNKIVVYTAFRDKKTYDKHEREIGEAYYTIDGNVDFVHCLKKDHFIINNAKKNSGNYMNEHTDFDAYYNCAIVVSIRTKLTDGTYKYFGYLCCDCLNTQENIEVFDTQSAQLLFALAQQYATYIDTLDSNWIDRINGLDELPQGFLQLIYSKTILGKSA